MLVLTLMNFDRIINKKHENSVNYFIFVFFTPFFCFNHVLSKLVRSWAKISNKIFSANLPKTAPVVSLQKLLIILNIAFILLISSKETRTSEPLSNQSAVVQRKNIFACEVMLPKTLVHRKNIKFFWLQCIPRSFPCVLMR